MDTAEAGRGGLLREALAIFRRDHIRVRPQADPAAAAGAEAATIPPAQTPQTPLVSRTPTALTTDMERFYDLAWLRAEVSAATGGENTADRTSAAAASSAVVPEAGVFVYKLVGIVEHRGSVSGGHYVAFARARNQPEPPGQQQAAGGEGGDGQWCLFDDATVTQCKGGFAEVVKRAQPYLLVYEREM
jgi:ubiquitin carboxyl-terminal hydrolase 16/45